jgi:predicted small metal-binding protein
MAKVLRCRDAGLDCDFAVRAAWEHRRRRCMRFFGDVTLPTSMCSPNGSSKRAMRCGSASCPCPFRQPCIHSRGVSGECPWRASGFLN